MMRSFSNEQKLFTPYETNILVVHFSHYRRRVQSGRCSHRQIEFSSSSPEHWEEIAKALNGQVTHFPGQWFVVEFVYFYWFRSHDPSNASEISQFELRHRIRTMSFNTKCILVSIHLSSINTFYMFSRTHSNDDHPFCPSKTDKEEHVLRIPGQFIWKLVDPPSSWITKHQRPSRTAQLSWSIPPSTTVNPEGTRR